MHERRSWIRVSVNVRQPEPSRFPGDLITNATAAKQISDLMIELKDQMMESLSAVKESCSPEGYPAYTQQWGE
jgi:hypothetical protein